jgi:hypothetical protein
MPAGHSPSSSGSVARFGVAALIGFAVPFFLVFYLAMSGGGYDGVVYGEVGIACWWAVVIGALVGLLPMARVSPAGWVLLGLLAAFALWTALGISWSESSERSVAELGRVAALLGVLALAVSIQGREGLRRAVHGVGAAIALVAVLSLLSRLVPDLFPDVEAALYLDDVQARLAYPLNYWNALATLMAIGIPLLLGIGLAARSRLLQGLAPAAVPVMTLVAYYTLSRGGAGEIAIAVVVLLAFHPRRWTALFATGAAALGSAVLVLAATGKNALQDGHTDSAASSQGVEMLLITLVVCALVGIAVAAILAAAERGVGAGSAPERRTVAIGAGALAAVVLLGAVAAGVPAKVSDKVDEFTESRAPDPTAGGSRFESLSGNGRYQLWSSAVDANATAPLVGIGPGTFEFWWTEDRPIDSYARSAHSLYLNALAEQGIVGFLLVLALVLFPIGVGIARWSRAGPGAAEERALIAAALAALVAFAVGAGVDRAWDLTVLPAAFLLLAAPLLTPREPVAQEAVEDRFPAGLGGIAPRLGVLVAGFAATIAIAIPTTTLISIRDSQADFRSGDLDAALDSARSAAGIEPYAATPEVQSALILEREGVLAAAAAHARAATERESTNWRNWILLARIEAERGNPRPALAAYERGRRLNPLSDFFRP